MKSSIAAASETGAHLKVDVLQVRGAAVLAVWELRAQQVGQTGAGVVLSLPGEGHLEGEKKKDKVYYPNSFHPDGKSSFPLSPPSSPLLPRFQVAECTPGVHS